MLAKLITQCDEFWRMERSASRAHTFIQIDYFLPAAAAALQHITLTSSRLFI